MLFTWLWAKKNFLLVGKLSLIVYQSSHSLRKRELRGPDLVDTEVADVLERESVDVSNDRHSCYLCLYLESRRTINVMSTLEMLVEDDLSCNELKENIGRGIELLNRQSVWVPFS